MPGRKKPKPRTRCVWCGERFEAKAAGRPQKYCKPTHRRRAWEARNAAPSLIAALNRDLDALTRMARRKRDEKARLRKFIKLIFPPQANGGARSGKDPDEAAEGVSYGILVIVRGVLPDKESRRLLTGSNGQPMTFPTREQAEAAAARLASVPGEEFTAVPLPTAKEASRP